jgi:hypothetical protein
MSGTRQITYAVNFWARSKRRSQNVARAASTTAEAVPRIARLLALAIRMEGLVRGQAVRDYAAVARLGGVTRARMTQIMKLCNLAADIQEQILFLPPVTGVNERNLRPISQLIDWTEQRCLWQRLLAPVGTCGRPPAQLSAGRTGDELGGTTEAVSKVGGPLCGVD